MRGSASLGLTPGYDRTEISGSTVKPGLSCSMGFSGGYVEATGGG